MKNISKDNAQIKCNDMLDILIDTHAQLSALSQLIGESNNDILQVNSYGLSMMIGNIGKRLEQEIEEARV